MARKVIDIGNTPNDDSGDTLRSGGIKINANFSELYGRTKQSHTRPPIAGNVFDSSNPLKLSYNNTNLKVSDGKLNTIQAINPAATPTFAGAKLTKAVNFSDTIDAIKRDGQAVMKIDDQRNVSFTRRIGSPTFTPGFTGTGWSHRKENSSYHLTTDRVTIREYLWAYEFIINQISTIGGSEIMGAGNGKIEAVSGTAPNESITLKDPDGNNACSLKAGDMIMTKQIDVSRNTVIKTVVREVASVTNNEVSLRPLAGAPSDIGTFSEGDVVLVFGSTSDPNRQSVIYRSVVDGGSPFVRVLDNIDSWAAWKTAVPKVEYGNLEGRVVNGASLKGSGLFTENYYGTGTQLIGDLSKQSHYMEYASGNLTVQGAIRVKSGSQGIDKFSDAGQLATKDTNYVEAEAQAAVDALEIGGRNLVLDSGEDVVSSTSDYHFKTYFLSEQLQAGRQYTFSINAKVDQALRDVTGELRVIIYSYESGGSGPWNDSHDFLIFDTNYDTYETTFTPPRTNQYYISCYRNPEGIANQGHAYMNWAQVEKGVVSTGWRPNPEDGAIPAAKGLTSAGNVKRIIRGSDIQYGNLVDGLNFTGDHLGFYDKPSDTWKAFIKGDGSGFLANRNISWNAQGDWWMGHATKGIAYDSATGQVNLGDNVSLNWGDKYQIGGRNLIRNSNFEETSGGDYVHWTPWLSTTVNASSIGAWVIQGSDQAYAIVSSPFKIEAGKKYTLSFKASSHYSTGRLGYNYIIYNDGGANEYINVNKSINGEGRHVIHFTAPRSDNNAQILIGAKDSVQSNQGFDIGFVKLEEGDVATAWSPSPYDILEESKNYTNEVVTQQGGTPDWVKSTYIDFNEVSSPKIIGNFGIFNSTVTVGNSTYSGIIQDYQDSWRLSRGKMYAQNAEIEGQIKASSGWLENLTVKGKLAVESSNVVIGKNVYNSPALGWQSGFMAANKGMLISDQGIDIDAGVNNVNQIEWHDTVNQTDDLNSNQNLIGAVSSYVGTYGTESYLSLRAQANHYRSNIIISASRIACGADTMNINCFPVYETSTEAIGAGSVPTLRISTPVVKVSPSGAVDIDNIELDGITPEEGMSISIINISPYNISWGGGNIIERTGGGRMAQLGYSRVDFSYISGQWYKGMDYGD